MAEGTECEAVYWASHSGSIGAFIWTSPYFDPRTILRSFHRDWAHVKAFGSPNYALRSPARWFNAVRVPGEVDKLLSRGMNPNYIHGRSGLTPLFAAVNSGHQAVISRLVDAGADVNHQIGKDRSTVLHTASKRGDLATVELLVSRGASLNAVDGRGKTPSDVANEADQMDVLSYLNGAQMTALLNPPSASTVSSGEAARGGGAEARAVGAGAKAIT